MLLSTCLAYKEELWKVLEKRNALCLCSGKVNDHRGCRAARNSARCPGRKDVQIADTTFVQCKGDAH